MRIDQEGRARRNHNACLRRRRRKRTMGGPIRADENACSGIGNDYDEEAEDRVVRKYSRSAEANVACERIYVSVYIFMGGES